MSMLRTFLRNEHNASKSLKVANVAMGCDRDADINRAKMVNTIDTIMQKDPGVELVIFGEMILGWYKPSSPEYHRQVSEPASGKTTQMLAALAQKHNIYVCFGMSESDDGALYNAQILLNPQGEIQAVHRKRNLKEAEKKANYQPGSKMVTITEIRGIKTGIVICSDTASFRTMWELIKSRLDLIIISLTDDDEDDFVTKFQGRLFDAWVVTANRYGKEDNKYWPGLIVVTDPLGEIQSAKQGQEQFSINELYFGDKGHILRIIIRNVWVKTRLIAHVLRNLKRGLSCLARTGGR
jgi:predicted amidohydrolase